MNTKLDKVITVVIAMICVTILINIIKMAGLPKEKVLYSPPFKECIVLVFYEGDIVDSLEANTNRYALTYGEHSTILKTKNGPLSFPKRHYILITEKPTELIQEQKGTS